MKILFVFPPQWIYTSPSAGIPALAGYLKSLGYDAASLDLNIGFYNHILKQSYLENSYKKAISTLDELSNEFKNIDTSKQDIDKLPLETKIKLQRFKWLKENIIEIKELSLKIPSIIEECVQNFKSKNFYNPTKLYYSYYYMEQAFKIASAPYHPLIISSKNYYYENEKFSYEIIRQVCFDKNSNIFIDYFEPFVEEFRKSDIDCVGVSINGPSQLIPGLTLASMIKAKTNIHVSLGGSHITREDEYIKNNKEFFEIFADSVTVGDGEIALSKLLEYMEGKISVEEVPSLIYKNNTGEIAANSQSTISFNKVPVFSFDGYKLGEYFMKEKVLPLQVSRGCYWGKCTFCDYNTGKHYSIKSVDNVIDEIKYLQNKYNVNHFYFIDSTISPSFLEEFSEKIIKNQMKIYYFSHVRFEKQFTKKLLRQMYKSGMRICKWGMESASERILSLINKGIEIKEVKRILKDASDVGLINHVYLIAGFPTETIEEFDKTVDFLKKYKKHIDTVAFHNFCLVKNSYIAKNPEQFEIDKEDIKNLKKSHYFYPKPKYIELKYINDKIEEIRRFYSQDSAFYRVFAFFGHETRLLYSIKYPNKFIRKLLYYFYKI